MATASRAATEAFMAIDLGCRYRVPHTVGLITSALPPAPAEFLHRAIEIIDFVARYFARLPWRHFSPPF